MVENGKISGDEFIYEHNKAIQGQEHRAGYFCQYTEATNTYLKSILNACNSEIYDFKFTIDCNIYPSDQIIATAKTNSIIIAYRFYQKGKIIVRKIAVKDGDTVKIIRDENNKVTCVQVTTKDGEVNNGNSVRE